MPACSAARDVHVGTQTSATTPSLDGLVNVSLRYLLTCFLDLPFTTSVRAVSCYHSNWLLLFKVDSYFEVGNIVFPLTRRCCLLLNSSLCFHVQQSGLVRVIFQKIQFSVFFWALGLSEVAKTIFAWNIWKQIYFKVVPVSWKAASCVLCTNNHWI